ncbi:MAG TPA: class I SAM-dependent methyltransferase [Pyrinomonadaceae bacterium]|nr:class I SAM-dependent methyltransferase [Pyrinomonadaceae bacterium]
MSYWDEVAGQKRFSHPLRQEWLESYLGPGARVLDYGCGYGRTLREMARAGYGNVVGVDFSAAMLARCRREFPQVSLVRNDGRTLPFRAGSLDAVLLFATLTCIPQNDAQRALIAEVERALCPGGLLYISDLLINEDPRNSERYERYAEVYGAFGVFELPEGVVVRHHRKEWIEELTSSFARLEYEPFSVMTMNGNISAAFQYLGRKEASNIRSSSVNGRLSDAGRRYKT